MALRDDEYWIRSAAVDALEGIGGTRAAETLAVALADPDVDLREQAVQALGTIGGPTAIRLLEYARAGDLDASVRATAAAWLDRCPGERQVASAARAAGPNLARLTDPVLRPSIEAFTRGTDHAAGCVAAGYAYNGAQEIPMALRESQPHP